MMEAWADGRVRLEDDTESAVVDDFALFYEASWPGAVRLAALLTQDASVAEEIAQEALATLFRRWGSVRDPAGFLYRCVVNGSRMYHRHRVVVRKRAPVLMPELVADAGFDHLAQLVAELPHRQRAVLVLRYYCDFSEREIAAALDCRVGTVKSLASRALARLEGELPR
jgi:RNA polymerase sigma factor (sigma-70 family)